MRSALALLVMSALPGSLPVVPPDGLGPGPLPAGSTPTTPPTPPTAPDSLNDVILLKPPGVLAYEEVAESFSDLCRVRLRPVTLTGTTLQVPLLRELFRHKLRGAALVVAVGQQAVDVAAGTPLRLAYALAPDPPPGAIGAESTAPPEISFRQLLFARPKVRRIAVVSTARGAQRLLQGRLAAARLGLTFYARAVSDGPEAIRTLRDFMQMSPPPDALWLGADPQLITTPVFQYALQLQLRYGLPVLAATRQQVRSGALLSVDWGPRAIGRRLGVLSCLALAGERRPELPAREDPAGSPEVTLNRLMAHKLGIDMAGLRAAGWRIE